MARHGIPGGRARGAGLAVALSALSAVAAAGARADSFHLVAAPAASPAVSADGRFVAFVSRADLVPGNLPGDSLGVYVHDRLTGATELGAAVPPSPTLGVDLFFPALSGDGRFVTFESAEGLVAADGDERRDVYLLDRRTATVELVSDALGGLPAGNAAISGDGRRVAFELGSEVWVRDRAAGTTTPASVVDAALGAGRKNGADPSLSGDGRFVAFESTAQLTADDLDDGELDVYLRDLAAGATRLVSAPAPGGDAAGRSFDPTLSADGRWVVFKSSSRLLASDGDGTVDLYVRSLVTGELELLDGPLPFQAAVVGGPDPSISGDGRLVAFMAEPEAVFEGQVPTFLRAAFLHDRITGTSRRVALPTDEGAEREVSSLTLSADGRHLVFEADGREVFAADLALAPVAPAVAADAEGTFLMVWEGRDGAGVPAVFARAHDAAGTVLGGDFQVNESAVQEIAGGPATEPAVAATGPGIFLVVWTDAGGAAIRARAVTVGPGLEAPVLGAERQVSPPPPAPEGMGVGAPAVAALPGERAVVVWESFDLPRGFARQDVSGVLVAGEESLPFAVAASPVPEFAPDVAAVPGGGFAVVWAFESLPELRPGDTGVNSRRFAADATPAAPVVVNLRRVGKQQAPALASRGDEEPLAVWESQGPGSDFGVFARLLPAGEGSPDPELQVNTSVAGDQRAPAAAADAAGNLLLVWLDEGAGAFKGQRLLASGAFVEGEIDLGPAAPAAGRARAASLGGGRFAVAVGRPDGPAALLVDPSPLYQACGAGLCASRRRAVAGEAGGRPLVRRQAVPRGGSRPW